MSSVVPIRRRPGLSVATASGTFWHLTAASVAFAAQSTGPSGVSFWSIRK